MKTCEIKGWKKFRLERDSNAWPLRYRYNALPTELSSQLGACHVVSRLSDSTTCLCANCAWQKCMQSFPCVNFLHLLLTSYFCLITVFNLCFCLWSVNYLLLFCSPCDSSASTCFFFLQRQMVTWNDCRIHEQWNCTQLEHCVGFSAKYDR